MILLLWLLEAPNLLKLMASPWPSRLRKPYFQAKLDICEVCLLPRERVSFIILRKVPHRLNLSNKVSMLARMPISILKILMILSSRTTCKRNPKEANQTLSLPERISMVIAIVYSSGAAWKMTKISQRRP
jgi:hypothetical protein